MFNKVNVFLDDIRYPNMSHNETKGLGTEFSESEKWVIVRDYFTFIDLVEKNFDQIELISFDHDLACYHEEKELTGKDAVDYLINFILDNNKKFPDWYVHSDNTTGKSNMIGSILNYMKFVEDRDVSNFRYYHNGIVNNKPLS